MPHSLSLSRWVVLVLSVLTSDFCWIWIFARVFLTFHVKGSSLSMCFGNGEFLDFYFVVRAYMTKVLFRESCGCCLILVIHFLCYIESIPSGLCGWSDRLLPSS